MFRQNSSVTIQDVARETQVSVSTVSRVLNEKEDRSVEIRRRVLEVLKTWAHLQHGRLQQAQ